MAAERNEKPCTGTGLTTGLTPFIDWCTKAEHSHWAVTGVRPAIGQAGDLSGEALG